MKESERVFSALRACHRPLGRTVARTFRELFAICSTRWPRYARKNESGSSRSVRCQSFSPVRPLSAEKTLKNRNEKNRKNGELWTAIYPPRMAPIGLKLGQNAFQTIPNISFFDPAKKQIGEIGLSKILFFSILVRFSRIYVDLDVKFEFSMQNDPWVAEFQLSMTLGGGVKSQKTILMSTYGEKWLTVKAANYELCNKTISL